MWFSSVNHVLSVSLAFLYCRFWSVPMVPHRSWQLLWELCQRHRQVSAVVLTSRAEPTSLRQMESYSGTKTFYQVIVTEDLYSADQGAVERAMVQIQVEWMGKNSLFFRNCTRWLVWMIAPLLFNYCALDQFLLMQCYRCFLSQLQLLCITALCFVAMHSNIFISFCFSLIIVWIFSMYFYKSKICR